MRQPSRGRPRRRAASPESPACALPFARAGRPEAAPAAAGAHACCPALCPRRRCAGRRAPLPRPLFVNCSQNTLNLWRRARHRYQLAPAGPSCLVPSPPRVCYISMPAPVAGRGWAGQTSRAEGRALQGWRGRPGEPPHCGAGASGTQGPIQRGGAGWGRPAGRGPGGRAGRFDGAPPRVRDERARQGRARRARAAIIEPAAARSFSGPWAPRAARRPAAVAPRLEPTPLKTASCVAWTLAPPRAGRRPGGAASQPVRDSRRAAARGAPLPRPARTGARRVAWWRAFFCSARLGSDYRRGDRDLRFARGSRPSCRATATAGES
jgi:hypothetical protein